jgi:osmotically-inducible protein OsmY
VIHIKKIVRVLLCVVLALSIAACATAQPPRTAEEKLADRQLADAVAQKLSEDPNIYAVHIDVSARAGVVTLSGYVFESNDLFAAPQLAAKVPGVTSVVNQMSLEIMGRGGRR